MQNSIKWLAKLMEDRLKENKGKINLPRATVQECKLKIEQHLEKVSTELASLEIEKLVGISENKDILKHISPTHNDVADIGNWLLMLIGIDVNDCDEDTDAEFTIVSYRQSKTCYCRNCEVGRSDSAFEINYFRSEKEAVEWMSDKDVTSHFAYEEASWEHYHVNSFGNVFSLSGELEEKVSKRTKEKIAQKIAEDNKIAKAKYQRGIEDEKEEELALLDKLKKKYER